MTKLLHFAPAIMALPFALLVPQQAQAVETISFDTLDCKTDSSNFCRLADTYGDTDKVDVSYGRINPSTEARLTGLHRYGTGYGDLIGVVFAARGNEFAGEITLAAAAGFELSLLGFDFASFAGRIPTVPLLITDLAGGKIIETTRATGGSLHSNLAVNSAFGDGVVIRFGPNAYDIGLDNIRYEVRAIAGAVPEPGTWALLIIGFGAIGAGMRRRPAQGRAQFSLA